MCVQKRRLRLFALCAFFVWVNWNRCLNPAWPLQSMQIHQSIGEKPLLSCRFLAKCISIVGDAEDKTCILLLFIKSKLAPNRRTGTRRHVQSNQHLMYCPYLDSLLVPSASAPLPPRSPAHIMNGWRICLRQCVSMAKMNQSNTRMSRSRRLRPSTKCMVMWIIIINRNDVRYYDIPIYANNHTTIWKRVSPLSFFLSLSLTPIERFQWKLLYRKTMRCGRRQPYANRIRAQS